MDISIFGRKMSIVKHKECSAILSRVTLVGLLFFFFWFRSCGFKI